MKTLTLQIPDTVDEKDGKMHLAAHLYEKGVLSDHFKKLWRSRVDFQIRDSSSPIIKAFSILIDIFSCRRPSSFS